MTPNLTVSYMAAEATQRDVARRAARGWLAEQSVPREDWLARPAAAVGRWLVARGSRSPRVVATATRIVLAAGAAEPLREDAG